jgi:uncharacterized protein (TIGR03067 family)
MKRLTLTLTVACVSMAFAPAPFPRPRRADPDELSLNWFQGTWDVVDHETAEGARREKASWTVTQIRISGSRWTLLTNGREVVGSYTIAIDGRPRPAQIDWFPLEQPNANTLWVGLIKREGDRVQILYSDGGSPRKRARDFFSAPAGSYLITVRRR